MKQEDPEKLGNESAYEDATEMSRRVRRGDESKGDADERDVAGDYADDRPDNTDPARDQGLGGRRVPSWITNFYLDEGITQTLGALPYRHRLTGMIESVQPV
jgi:hypothetical protein